MNYLIKQLGAVLCIIFFAMTASAETWDQIRTSGEYYYGVGVGATEAEADQAALADMVRQIATHVSADFTQIDDMQQRNGEVNHDTRVLNCVRTYAQTTLTNTEKWVDGKAPDITVRRFMKKSELSRMYEGRIAKARDMVQIADECLANRKVDMALQYYYWAYSLVRSVQFPNEVKGADGKILVDWIPVRINQILSDINVGFLGRDGDYTDLTFTYQGEPVSSLEFSYSDGRTLCQGMAKDGRGMVEMLPGYETDVYHLDIEYEYKSQARGDAEMESVLAVITPKVFPKSAMKVSAKGGAGKSVSPKLTQSTGSVSFGETDLPASANQNSPADKSESSDNSDQKKILDKVIRAIESKNYSDAMGCFTIDGLQMFNRLVSYGKARLLDGSEIKFFDGLGGRKIARGLKMSFAHESKQRKKTFVEDVSFTFNPDGKIENVAFGLGKTAEDGIFQSKAQWPAEVREIIVSFMENYKTAYSLERLDYIRSIFADDAVIIVGNVARKSANRTPSLDGRAISLGGQSVINYNRYTKDSYLENLARCFNRNDFINLKFTDHQIQWLEKFDKEEIFAINIRQEYCSSSYADDGYLFLLVDMTNREEPLIKVRTWQPNEVSLDRLYNAGDFFSD